jgi:NAD+ diphosphatase
LSKTILPSGLRIVTEEVSTSRSAAVGIWANVGSRDEVKSVAGASHFLEHLLFKGTKTSTALEISSAIEAIGGERYFLGRNREDNRPYFAWASGAILNDVADYLTLRELAGSLGPLELEIAMHAIALANWHDVHPHCARCGAPTHVALGGAVRICDKDESQHHPRTDSAVIVLVKDKEDRILLGHQPIWPDGRFSTFAGFLEPGETFEQCVEREVFEESGVKVNEIKYLGSQPWPFPASIMIAFSAVVEDPSTAKADGVEITEVRWFSREDLKKSIADGSLLLPPTISVARKMIAMWFGPGADKLTGGESWR